MKVGLEIRMIKGKKKKTDVRLFLGCVCRGAGFRVCRVLRGMKLKLAQGQVITQLSFRTNKGNSVAIT